MKINDGIKKPLKKIVKTILYIVITIVAVIFLLLYIQLADPFRRQSTDDVRKFVLTAINGDTLAAKRYKTTPDYIRLLNTTSKDSIDYYYEKYKVDGWRYYLISTKMAPYPDQFEAFKKTNEYQGFLHATEADSVTHYYAFFEFMKLHFKPCF